MEFAVPYDKEQFWTVSRIAEHLNEHRHRVEFAIKARCIEPIGRAGAARIFSQADADRIGEELKAIDARREAVAS